MRIVNNKINVTNTAALAPAAQHRKLAPWLALANAVRGEEEFASAVRRIKLFRDYAKEHQKDCRILAELVRAIFVYIERNARKLGSERKSRTELFDFEEIGLPPPRLHLELRGDGRAEIHFDYKYLEFQAAFAGIELARIRVCPQCSYGVLGADGVWQFPRGKFFYAKRTARPGAKDTSSKTCSSKCATALRTTKWREKWSEYHTNRKIADNRRAKSEGKAR